MTDAELREMFDLLRTHSTAMVHPLLTIIETAWNTDRAVIEALRAKVMLLDGVVGHRVYSDNDDHSRRVTDLRSVS